MKLFLGMAIMVISGFSLSNANPIVVGPPAIPDAGIVRIENLADFPDFVVQWELTTRDPGSVAFAYPPPPPPCAMAKSVYDSAYAALSGKSLPASLAMREFVRSDPRKVCAEGISPSSTLPAGFSTWCEEVEDVYHVVALNATQFKVKPVRAIYHLLDGTTLELPYDKSGIRSLPSERQISKIKKSGFYSLLSSTALTAFAISIFFARRRRQHA